MTKNPILATNPGISAIVKASAGVGKTYLLVTRLMRLLLAGVKPDAILAITFTRKASAEMQSRLFERLYALAIIPESDLIKELGNIGLDASPAMIQSARQLYEKLILSEQQIRTSTFHAFCQAVLRKFPLEADIPPGFELLDDEISYRATAWDSLYDEATHDPQCNIAQALEVLYELSNSLHNTHQSLDSFLSQRSDWWAYTQGKSHPVDFAIQRLRDELQIDPSDNPYIGFFSVGNREKLSRLVQLLNLHDTKTNLKNADKIQATIENEVFVHSSLSENIYEKTFNALYAFFINKDGENRHKKPVKSRAKKLGENGEIEFIEICQSFTIQLISFNEQRLKHHTFHLSSAWYTVGHHLISLYQKIKREQRLLDFVDLEWNTYLLLNHSENALWVQYKLDQRIDHLLIDEFQDTNPTQWHLILPLLEEFASIQDTARSVFIVGDEKQSIYGFRRADPRLLNQAGEWLAENLQAKTFPMDKSRRSSPAVMNLLNSLFQSPYFEQRLPGFHEHSTFLTNMPGEITLLPLIEKEKSSEQAIHFRNSLEHALPREDQPYFREGQQIAAHIHQLVAQKTAITSDNEERPIVYADIMLLVRSRTHVAEYERAFREAALPYLSNNRGTLFECQEIQDLLALMDVLYTPFNNLAFATVLRSPIFQCSNDDLMFIARQDKRHSWFQTSLQLCEKNLSSTTLSYAINSLSRWRILSGHLPIHDLLDMIFHEANIFQQYETQIPSHFKRRVRANLSQFLSVALETESGRYPSLGRFIGKIRNMIQNDDSPDEASGDSLKDAIRILTIHAAKGLEAPVVFLADSADVKNSANNSHQALIQWPENEDKPRQFLLCPVKNKQAEHIRAILKNNERKTNIEDANLLYVALTRARQALYISGCSKGKSTKPSWYSLIKDNWPDYNKALPVDSKTTKALHKMEENPTLNLNTLLFHAPAIYAAETTSSADKNEHSILRGTIIHRILELMDISELQEIKVQLREEFSNKVNDDLIQDALQEAQAVFTHAAFADFFDDKRYVKAMNELPILLNINGTTKSGIIDRVILSDNDVTILDYKTHRDVNIAALPDIAASYQKQMYFYREVAEKLWPEKCVRLIILFTHFLETIELR